MGLKSAFGNSAMANYIRSVKAMPREVCFNGDLLFAAFFYSQAAVPATWDQGQASVVTSLPGFQQHFGICKATDASEIRHIVSLVYVGDGIGAALSYFFNDRLGRLWSFRLYTLVLILGQLVATFAPGVAGLYASRIITGLGIGSLSASAPMAIAEISPPEIRGMLTAWYPVMMGIALLAANFCVYGVGIHVASSKLQFQIVWIAPCVYMAIWLAASFFICESPRWLLLRDRQEEAVKALVRLRGLPANHPRLQKEIDDMREDIHQSMELYSGGSRNASGLVSIIRETFTVPENLRLVQQALILYALPQLSGANAMTSYLVPILEIVGASGDAQRNVLLSGMYAMSKFFFALIASLFFIDILGRRKSLFIGITIQMLTDLYLGVYIQRKQSSVGLTKASSQTAIAAIYLHAFGYATGLFVLPYVFGGELWPNRIRSFGAALSQCWHWLFHYAMTAAAPSLLEEMDNWGAFIFYAAWCLVALIYVYLVVPEIATLSLEEIDNAFKGSWFKAYRRNSKLVVSQNADSDRDEKQG